ncbi:hypothetical protein Y1Q_0006166 [Alligator mississippiensis]|uniref:Uncharacterized protein n=1 Tax=Alligator mississippiensis TaxID=8496 RepID=A0A151NWR2_ALLMI|nr:hypothetical protein Y1Q_0006166 [Alligator mississippiensis]
MIKEDPTSVGERTTFINIQMNACKKSIKDRNPHFPVEAHFSQNDHSLANLSVLILKGNLQNIFKRRAYELNFITTLDTKNHGLNRDMSYLSHYSLPKFQPHWLLTKVRLQQPPLPSDWLCLQSRPQVLTQLAI